MAQNILNLIDEGKKIGFLQHQEEIIGLASFVAGLKPKNVLEIGSWKGGTFYVLTKLSSGTRISIDLDAYGDLPGTMDERNQMFSTWGQSVHTIIGDSHHGRTIAKAVGALRGEQLDFALIDGDHSYEGVKIDYEMYKNLVTPGGWIAFHDIVDTPKHRESGCFVGQFWQELEGDKLEICVNGEWGGFGLIRNE